MTVQFELPRKTLDNILDGLATVITGDSDSTLDLNFVAEESDVIHIYVKKFNNIQILHTIRDGGEIKISVDEPRRSVFSSQILRDVVKKSKQERLKLKLVDDNFRIQVGDQWFTQPLEIELPLYHGSEFQERIENDSMEQIASLNREHTIEALSMMSVISPEFGCEIKENKLWIRVSDTVNGSGDVMQQLESPPDIGDSTFEYETNPVLSYLNTTTSDNIDLYLSTDGALKLITERGDHSSSLMLARRIVNR
ncbi:hypothetical protein [Halohasta litorea]|uniref:Uncharacterized protein n=1 Tax=Halohasta litorea TaxID=869891 RepID=A0ABD6D8W1_9EURY|nr:hypothetical protein [Halohasta litorea]